MSEQQENLDGAEQTARRITLPDFGQETNWAGPTTSPVNSIPAPTTVNGASVSGPGNRASANGDSRGAGYAASSSVDGDSPVGVPVIVPAYEDLPSQESRYSPSQPDVERSGPVAVIPPPPPMIVPATTMAPPKRSPLLAILLGLALVAAAAFAFLWHKASNDTDTAKQQTVNVQAQLSDATTKAAADLAAAKKAADAAAVAAAAADKQTLDAASARAAAAAAAAAAKAQTDQAAAVAAATANADATGKAKADDLQAQLGAANAAMAATQATLTSCKAASAAMAALTPGINDLVALRDADIAGDIATSQAILARFDNANFNTQVAALNAAQAACAAG
jgi:hypothetical protein